MRKIGSDEDIWPAAVAPGDRQWRGVCGSWPFRCEIMEYQAGDGHGHADEDVKYLIPPTFLQL
jgi:hypothetical protein